MPGPPFLPQGASGAPAVAHWVPLPPHPPPRRLGHVQWPGPPTFRDCKMGLCQGAIADKTHQPDRPRLVFGPVGVFLVGSCSCLFLATGSPFHGDMCALLSPSEHCTTPKTLCNRDTVPLLTLYPLNTAPPVCVYVCVCVCEIKVATQPLSSWSPKGGEALDSAWYSVGGGHFGLKRRL